MSFIRITKANIDTSTLVLHPSRSFSSSSISGVTGSIRVIAQSSPFFKEASKSGPFVDAPLDASSIEDFRKSAWLAATGSGATSFVASGSLTGSRSSYPPEIPSGRTLELIDGAGNVYSAITDDTLGKTASTAKIIGTDALATNTELMESIYTSLYEALAFGVDSTTKGAYAGSRLRIEPLVFPTDEKMAIELLDTGYQGNHAITGSLVGLASPDLTVAGLEGGVGESLESLFMDYLSKVTNAGEAARQSKYVEILRFVPTNTFTSDTVRKNVFRKVLMPLYKTECPDLEWAFMNNQCFNFVSSSAFPSASCLIYPDPLDNYQCVTGMTLQCNVKLPRTVKGEQPFTPGTLIFRSSSYALSVVTGSSRDPKGQVDGFRFVLQLSHSVDIDPSLIDLTISNNDRTYPQDYVYVSSDNTLKLNHWHNICATWGAEHNSGTGSFFIDGIKDEDTEFFVSTASMNTTYDAFNAVFVGTRFDNGDGSADMSGFFNPAVGTNEGVYSGGAAIEPLPTTLTASRFNGEINDIRIHSERISDDLILTGSGFGLTDITKGLVMYVPGFFVKESPTRKVLLTPFQATTEATTEPFNVKLAYGVRGRDINVQNFCRDFAQRQHPRLYFLTASTINVSTETYTADSFLLDIGANHKMHRARGMFVLPSDNGKFIPGWNLLQSGTLLQRPASGSSMSRFVNDLGNLNLGIVSLNNLMPTSSIFEGLLQVNSDGSDNTSKTGMLQEIMGSSPDDPSVDPGSGYTILQRTRDNSSNAVVFFDASNLFYGKQIMPGSMRFLDTALSGTTGSMMNATGSLSMKIMDNGRGTLYRADAASKHASWSAVGYTIYQEGISSITSPVIPFFGRDQFEIDLRGEQSLHILEVNAPALQGMLNSSSNPTFVPGTRDDYAANYEGTALGISSILFHDNNMNVIARTTLAQPILKTEFDKYMFRVKFDF